MIEHYKCIGCNSEFPTSEIILKCPKCNDLLDIRYDYDRLASLINTTHWKEKPFSDWRYRELLPINPESRVISLGEGGTGLHTSEHLAHDLNIGTLRIKFEGENPTGSFKDRGMTVGISKAIEVHARMVACASTGNTSASLAAYAGRAGLTCIVLIPTGKIARGKLAQAMAHGARILEIQGNFDDALRTIIEIARRNPSIVLLNSMNPYRIEGQKTLAFEICDQLQFKPPDVVIVPVGNAGNISAIWKGFEEFQRVGLIAKTPRLVGIQAEGAAPIASAFKRKSFEVQNVEHPETIATAIRIGAPASWKKALRAVAESGGLMETVSDQEILRAQRDLARREGIFAEPASASSIAGLRKLVEEKLIDRDEEIVSVITGHGLKDTEIVSKIAEEPVRTELNIEAIERLIGQGSGTT
jgi:threonine synthase